MTSLQHRLSLSLCVLQIFVTAIKGDFVDLPPKMFVQSLAEEETVLPCRFQPNASDVVVQVSWFKEKPDNSKDQIITANSKDGEKVFESWSQRARFKSSEPIVDSSLVIMNTAVSDEGKYICQISTFPSGNFEIKMPLIVWVKPISSLDPVVVVEGQEYRQVAACRSIGRPPPSLSWDTELNGRSINRTSENGAVSTIFSLHPLRSMNGKKLDCLVWHPAFPGPRRLQNNVVVHFPPHAEVSGYNGDWFVGLENAALRCVTGGNPKPHSFTWSRLGGELPQGAVSHPNGSLVFVRPINSSDEGTYQCEAVNLVGKAKAEVEIRLTETPQERQLLDNMTMLAAGGGLLLLMFVIIIIILCYHKRKSKKLRKEISTLSRQASFRRVNSCSTDAKGATDENVSLRMEGTLRTSMSSVGPDPALCHDSRSTISGGRGGGSMYDSLGRPLLSNGSRRGRDKFMDRNGDPQLRVEAFVRNSSLSLRESGYHPPLVPSQIYRQMNGSPVIPVNGGSRQGSIRMDYLPVPKFSSYPPVTDEDEVDGSSQQGSITKEFPHVPMFINYPSVTDEDEVDEGLGGPASQEHADDQASEASSSHVSIAPSTQSSKIRILPHLESPHASMIHRAQIV